MAALAITAANVKKISGVSTVKTVKTGVTIAAGKVATLDGTVAVLADNDTSPLSTDETIYIAVTSSSPEQEVALMTTGAIIDLGVTGHTGEFFYLGDSGDFVPYGDLVTYDFVVQLGHFNVDDNFVVNIIQTGVQL